MQAENLLIDWQTIDFREVELPEGKITLAYDRATRMPLLAADIERVRKILDDTASIPDELKIPPERDDSPLAERKIKPPRQPRATLLYLMLNKRNGYWKIGISNNPEYREKTLQAEDPQVHMMYLFHAFDTDEKDLHSEFASKRLRGEWFALSESDVNSIVPRFPLHS